MAYLREHLKICDAEKSVPKVRPVRIAATGQRKLLAIISRFENEDAEWVVEDLVDPNCLHFESNLGR